MAAALVRLKIEDIFDLCIDGKGPEQIARILEEKQILTAKALYAKRKKKPMPEKPYHWGNQSIVGILERQEYTGCTLNFKTYSKSYKLKKRIPNNPEDMFYLPPDTQEAIVSQAQFATVYKGNIIKNLIMDCQSYTKYRPNETTGGIFVSWRRKEELPTGA